MDEYISREATLDVIREVSERYADENLAEFAYNIVINIPAADVQPLSVVSEHIKNRLYETAFNEPDTASSDVIADMAERIDFWINELKVGNINE